MLIVIQLFLSSYLMNGEHLLWYEKLGFVNKLFFYTQGRIFLVLLGIFIAFIVTTLTSILNSYHPYIDYLVLFSFMAGFLVLTAFINVLKINIYYAVSNTRLLSYLVTYQFDGIINTAITSITHNMVVRFHQSKHFMAFEVNTSENERLPITRLAFNWVEDEEGLMGILHSLSGKDLITSLPTWDLPEQSSTCIDTWRISFQSCMYKAVAEDNATLLWTHKPTFYQIVTSTVITSWWTITLWAMLMTTFYSIWGPYIVSVMVIIGLNLIVLIVCVLVLKITLGVINNYEAYYALTDKGLILIHYGFRTVVSKIPFSQVFPIRSSYIKKQESGDLFTVSLHNLAVMRGIPNLKALENAVYHGALRTAASSTPVIKSDI